MMLAFDISKLPRTLSRAEWRALHRWRRVTQRKLREQAERDRECLAVFGSSHPLTSRLIERLINPPVLYVDPATFRAPK